MSGRDVTNVYIIDERSLLEATLSKPVCKRGRCFPPECKKKKKVVDFLNEDYAQQTFDSFLPIQFQVQG